MNILINQKSKITYGPEKFPSDKDGMMVLHQDKSDALFNNDKSSSFIRGDIINKDKILKSNQDD